MRSAERKRGERSGPPARRVHVPFNVDHGRASFTVGAVQIFPESTEAVQVPEAPGVDPNRLAAMLRLEDCDGNMIVGMFDRNWQDWILEHLGQEVEFVLVPSCQFEFPFLFRLTPERRGMAQELLEGAT